MVDFRCYDFGPDVIDRYTVVFHINIAKGMWPGATEYPYLGMSSDPFHPQGFGQHGGHTRPVDAFVSHYEMTLFLMEQEWQQMWKEAAARLRHGGGTQQDMNLYNEMRKRTGIYAANFERTDDDHWFVPMLGRSCYIGTRIPFSDLPKDCQTLVEQDLKSYVDG